MISIRQLRRTGGLRCGAGLILALTLGKGAFCEPAPQAAQAAGLRIVVIEGEGAVNIIQQKTAVAPVVEVRDRNDQPVAGAIVNFAIRSGRASFSGARTLRVTTDLAGRAAASGFTPTASGALQISASAVFQGQTTAAVTIAQTTVMTAAQAAAASGAASGGTAAGTGAAGGGGGGGLSTTTIGIISGAAAGGVIAATKVLGGRTHYSGQFSGSETEGVGLGCQRTFLYSGTVEMDLDVTDGGTVSGVANVHGNWEMTALAATCIVPLGRTGAFDTGDIPVTGTTEQLAFNKEETITYPSGPFSPSGGFIVETFSFSGALSGGTIAGTLFHRQVNRLNQSTFVEEGSASFPVTLK
jgi:hypothetical protein